MDREWFDALTRLVAAQRSRRATLSALVGATLLGGGLETAAKSKKNKKPKTCFGTKRCPFPSDGRNFEQCNLAGVSAEDCNGCDFRGADLGNADFSGSKVQGASFRAANLRNAFFDHADASGASFRDACLVGADFLGADLHGASFRGAILCNTTFPNGQVRNGGCDKVDKCCPGPDTTECNKDSDCAGGRVCCDHVCSTRCGCPPATPTDCGGTCTDTTTDRNNCGACGNVCGSAHTTAVSCNGTCQLTCEAGYAHCSGNPSDGCETNTATDNDNCGTCGTTCSGGQFCANGSCECPAATPDLCAGHCTNLQSDNANCGTCGNACPSEQTCVGGSCECPAGQTFCGGHCTNTQTDPDNCGACGTVCPGCQSCVEGSCQGLICCAKNARCAFGDTCCDEGYRCDDDCCETPLGTLTCCGGFGEPCEADCDCCGCSAACFDDGSGTGRTVCTQTH
jgi:hypothetical protein